MPIAQTKSRYRYLVIPVVYCLIIIGLLFLQFSGNLTIRKTINQLTMVGTLLPGYDETGTSLSKAEIRFNGLIFPFSQDQSILLKKIESSLSAPLISYELEEQSIALSFSDNIVLSFEETNNNDLEIRLQVPESTSDLQTISLPISFFPEVIDSIQQRSTETLILHHKEADYLLVLPPGSVINAEQQRLEIPARYQTGVMRYTQITNNLSREETGLIISKIPPLSEQKYNQLRKDYLDSAFIGWTSSRYNGGSGTWEMYGIPAQFSEEIIVASLAEAWNRGESYIETFNKARRAASLNPESVTFFSAPFLGRLREVMRQTRELHSRRSAQLFQSMKSRDISLLESSDLFSFVIFHGDKNLQNALLDMLASLDWQSLSVPATIGLLNAYQHRDLFPTEFAAQIGRAREGVENIILRKLLLIQDKVFIETDPNEANILLSMQAGSLVRDIGREESNEELIRIGSRLVISGLMMADDLGFIPYSLLLGPTSAEPSEYRFGPESIYPFLTQNPAYPHYVSLEETGVWMWTISTISNVQFTEELFSFTVTGPVNQTHFILAQGLPEFTKMDLFGLIWRNDPTFEFYVRGRYYEPETNILMIKYNDSVRSRSVILSLLTDEGDSNG